MKKKENEFKSLVEETRKKEKIKKEKVNVKWIITIIVISFIISFCLSFVANSTIPHLNLIFGIIITLIFILIGILFDIIGVAVTSADEAVFHSMNSRKVKGAKVAVRFKKNADKVSSFCCDVIGDVCGIVSGTSGVVIVALIIQITDVNELLVSLIVTGVISALTIGGKALGKGLAINRSKEIVTVVSKILTVFQRKK